MTKKMKNKFRMIATLAVLSIAALAVAGGLKWSKDWKSATTEAKNGNKLIMIDFTAEWCGWCKKLDKDVFSTPAFQKLAADKFVTLKIDTDKHKDRSLGQKYGVTALPTIVFVNAAGKKVHEVSGYLPAKEFTAEMNKAWSKR